MAGLAAAFGSSAMTNSITEIEQTKIILVSGSNTTENHPIIGAAIKRAVTHHGAKLIVVDPRKIELAEMASVWLRPRPGTDIAWINGMIHIILEEGLYDRAYVQERTEGFNELKESVAPFTPEYVTRLTGIPAQALVAAARTYAENRAGIYYTMGITQHAHGTDNVKALANLALVCGNVGFPGAGVNPLRGQNNVQGACDMGGLPDVYSGYQKVTDPESQGKMEKVWGVRDLPGEVGLTLMEMTAAVVRGDVRGLYILGENPVLSDPDSTHLAAALQKLEFLVVQDLFLTETARLAHVVLPGASFAETDGTFTNTERRVQRVRRAIPPVGDSRPDWQVICSLSERMGYPMPYASAEEIFNEIRSVTPSYAGITYARIEREGLQWPCPTLDHPGTPVLHRDRFTRGLGKFHPVAYRGPQETPDPEFPLILSTGRILYHYHTGTMTRKTAGLEQVAPECRIEVSPPDAKVLNIQDGEWVKIISRRGEMEARASVTDRSPQGTIFVPFHYAEAAVNCLTQTALDPEAKIPELKVSAVRLEKIEERANT
ncbi:MAG: formate dehydrogenase subunit alpha [Deltaproteobacteria bacterium]|nr:formate dehydrogenase subunit alpha [Deltaproteobacteria bacterium]